MNLSNNRSRFLEHRIQYQGSRSRSCNILKRLCRDQSHQILKILRQNGIEAPKFEDCVGLCS